jgi:hypothetical protein
MEFRGDPEVPIVTRNGELYDQRERKGKYVNCVIFSKNHVTLVKLYWNIFR